MEWQTLVRCIVQCDSKKLIFQFSLISSGISEYSGNITVPVLWDKVQKTIVNNESSEIIRMLNKEFNAFCKTEEQRQLDFYPDDLKKEIDDLNDWVYPLVFFSL